MNKCLSSTKQLRLKPQPLRLLA